MYHDLKMNTRSVPKMQDESDENATKTKTTSLEIPTLGKHLTIKIPNRANIPELPKSFHQDPTRKGVRRRLLRKRLIDLTTTSCTRRQFSSSLSTVSTRPLRKHTYLIANDLLGIGPKGNNLNDNTTLTIRRTVAELNALFVFSQWDEDDDGYLSVFAVQRGLLNAGIMVDGYILRMAMRKIHLMEEDDHVHFRRLDARVFVKLLSTLSEHDLDRFESMIESLSLHIPVSKSDATDFVDADPISKHILEQESRSNLISKITGSESEKFRRDHIMQAEEEINELAEDTWSKNWFLIGFNNLDDVIKFRRGIGPPIVCCIAWILGFAIFYNRHLDFHWPRAYYYSAQAGLSIGFGALSEEFYGGVGLVANGTVVNEASFPDVTLSRWMTILNVLLGSSIIGGALSYFVNEMVKSHGKWYEEMLEKHRHGERLKAFHSEPQKSVSISIEYATHFYRKNRGPVRLLLCLFAFILCGMAFGMEHEKWDFTKSLYFCITTMSTAGLQAPNVDSDFSMYFTGTYTLIGVPLYAACLGLYANYLVQKNLAVAEEKHFEAVISSREHSETLKLLFGDENLSKRDELAAEELLSDLDEVDFVMLELLRTHHCSFDFFRRIRKMFRVYDSDGNGYVSRLEIVATNLFRMYGDLANDRMGVEMFRKCVHDMAQEPYKLIDRDASRFDTAMRRIFAKRQYVNLREFSAFVRTMIKDLRSDVISPRAMRDGPSKQ